MDHLPPLLVLILGLLAGAIVGAIFMWVRLSLRQRSVIEQACQRSVEQSRSTLKGKMAEQMAPLLAGFEYLPADARFLGDPVDYVVFDGYTAVKDDGVDAASLELVILDIKHGKANLTGPQRAIARAIEAGRVRFEVVRIAEDGTVRKQAVSRQPA
jgi:predicted Holliday junction resolvase-like endonuclease